MAYRYEDVFELMRSTAGSIVKDSDSWKQFLNTAAMNYKRPFHNQLLIFNQKPDATACATFDFWNQKMGRFVKKGSKGIVTIDLTSQKKEILFDISDTGSNNKSVVPTWTVTDEMYVPLGYALQEHFGTAVNSGDLAAVLFETGLMAAEEALPALIDSIQVHIKDSGLASFDDKGLENALRETLSNSLIYELLKRCALNPDDYSESLDFSYINCFNSNDTIAALGGAINVTANGLFKDISLAVRSIENVLTLNKNRHGEVKYNDNDIQQTGGLSDSERVHSETEDGLREVRNDAENLSDEREGRGIYVTANEGSLESTPERDRRDGDGERERIGSADGINGGRDGGIKGDQPDEVGGPYEQFPPVSSGDNSRGNDLRIDDEVSEALEAADDKHPNLSFEFVLTNVLQNHRHMHATGPEIQNFFLENTGEGERVEFLKEAYNKDYTELLTPGDEYRLGYHADADGLEVWIGSYLGAKSRVVVPWEVVVKAIDFLIDRDQLLSVSERVELPSEEQQAFFAVESENHKALPEILGLELPQQIIDEVICSGSNNRDSVFNICAFYKRNHTTDEGTRFLAEEYGSGTGKGFIIDSVAYSVLFEEDGIRIAEGKSVVSAEDTALLSWNYVDRRIKELLTLGRYMSAADYAAVEEKLLDKSAENIWSVHREVLSEEVCERFSLSAYAGLPLNFAIHNYSDVEAIKNELKKPDVVSALLDETRTLMEACKGREPELRLSRYKFNCLGEVLVSLDNLNRDVVPYPVAGVFEPSYKAFITDDEVDLDLIGGTGTQNGKYRIYLYFNEPHSLSEKVSFLKNEYGIGGGNGALGGVFHSDHSHDGKGIVLSKGSISKPYDSVTLSWNVVAHKIDDLIKSGRYLTDNEVENLPAYEKDFIANAIYNFFVDVPVEFERPFSFGSSRTEAVGDIIVLLDDISEAQNILSSMQVYMASLEDNARNYQFKELCLKYIERFASGVSLFDFEARKSEWELPGEETPSEEAKNRDEDGDVSYRYDIKPGDVVTLDGGRFVVVGMENGEVVLNDEAFPLFTQTYGLDEFNEKLGESSDNNIYRVAVTDGEEHDDKNVIDGRGEADAPVSEVSEALPSAETVYRYYFKFKSPEDGYPTPEGNEPLNVVVLDGRPYIEDFGIYSSGYVEYAKQLSVDDLNKYDLMLYEPPIVARETMHKYQLGFGALGNGTTVWNRLEREDGDYKIVAHISDEGVVTVYDKNMPQEALDKIQDVADKDRAAFEEKLRVAAEAFAEVEKRYATPKPEINRRTTVCKNYKLLNSFAGDVLSGKYDYMRFESEGYEPLYVERIGDNQIAMAHTFVQNGDLMYDPEMVFTFDNEKEELQALSYEMSGFGMYQRVLDDNGRANIGLQRELNSFLNTWLKNIVEQAQPLVRAVDRDGNEYNFVQDKEEELVFVGGEGAVPERGIVNVGDSFAIRDEEFKVKSIEGPGDDIDEVVLESVRDPGKFAVTTYGDIRKLLDDGLEQGPVAKKEEVLNDVLDVSKAAVESETLSQKRFGFDFDEYLRIKDLYPDDIVAYQVGDFYEFLGEDAEKVAKELDIVLTSRDVGLSERLAMCGVPSHAFRGFMDILVQNGYNIAVHGFNEQAGRVITVDYETQMASQSSANDILNDNDISDGDKLVFEPERLEQPERGMRAGHTTDARGEGTDYRIEHLAHDAKSPKERFRDNVAAISLLKQLEGENRLATAEEQSVLANYVGWGGLSDAFDESKSAWRSEYNQLLELLTPEEYSSAKASTLTAFYTSPEIIRFMYDTLESMGFKKGNILEPSCGVGNFIGMLPEGLADSKVYGVEIDSVSGRIAQQLYQKQDIQVQGFEKTDFPDSFFDVAIGNVPFGDFKVNDKKYNKNKFLIHDYFFAKALDKVRPGGVVAFITSKGTLDKEGTAVREYIAQRAEFLGAVRLPDNAFKANAGTEVTSDIIFLQKREKPIEVDMSEESWIHCTPLYDSGTGELLVAPNGEYMTINSYFAMHPENVLGEMKVESTQYGYDTACKAREGAELSDLFTNIHFTADKELIENSVEEQESSLDYIPADPSVRNFSYTLVDGKVYFRENSRMFPISFPNEETENRVKGLINLRGWVRALIDMQMEDYSDSAIAKVRQELNSAYDNFSKKYGLINDRKNKKAFESDNSYYLLASLENLDDEGKLKGKADIFYKRTIKPHVAVTHVDTSVEALEVSISEKACVDMPYMVDLSGKSAEEIEKDLVGVIFRVPGRMAGDGSPVFVPADEYLSGNVREKLRVAKEFSKQDEVFASNVKALEMVQPKDLDASEISIRLGTTWVPTEYIDEFMYELLETPSWCRGSYGVQTKFAPITGEWFIENKTRADHTVSANTTYGTKRISAYKIIEDTLNLRDARVYDYVEDENGRKKAVLNRDETTIAQQKQELIKDAFAEWIWKDPDRREYLTSYYNEHFNNIRPREYDGSHLSFGGINPEIELRKHQINAIARIIYGGNTLLAHAVGAGKTFEMVAAAQESKRLGLCNKSLFVVPNHLIEQFAADYMKLYPNANVLCSTKKDFEPGNRKRFCSRIATGDYDAIIIGHSQFEKIPLSPEEQRATIQEQLYDIESGIRALQHEKGERFSVKQLEKTKKNLEAKLERLTDESRKDDVITFEELGVDRLFVDEAHYYKNLFLYTKMRNVAGIGSREAQKSSDLYMKCRYLDKKTDGKGVIFATGTPISNSMTELYTMQRYLQYDMLCERGLQHFDSWASTFGETITAIELAPEGNGYRAKTRFARFYNLPELLATFKEVADVQTADMLHLPVPKANFHTVALQPSDIQKELVQGLAERAEAIRDKRVKPTQDNMLLVTNDGRKLALDQRLIDPMFGDFEDSKVNICVNNVFDVWEKTKDKKSTQLVFCDLSTPKSGEEFDVYNDIRNKLIAKGIPKNEIAFVHNAKTETQKKKLFEKMRNGTVRVLLGSTSKLGVGTNIQDRLITLHDIDCPWRPSDLEQRLGRIVRQGNSNDEVDIYRYVTQDTFDAYCWQLIENKQSFISQILTSKSPSRSAEDIDEAVLSYAEIKSLATGDPRIKEKMDLDVSVKRLKLLKQSYLRERYSLEDKVLKTFPADISRYTDLVAKCKKDIALFEKNTSTDSEYFFPMTVNGTVYADKGEAGAALIDFCKAQKKLTDEVPCGEYRGFKMSLAYDSWESTFKLIMQNELRYSVPLGNDKFGNITRINHLLSSLPEKLSAFENKLSDTYTQLENAQKQLQKPFAHEQELKEKSSRLDQLNIELSLDKDNAIDIASSFDEKETVATSSSGKSRDDEYER